MNLTVIRPLVYMKEADVIGFVHKHDVPVVKVPALQTDILAENMSSSCCVS